MWTPALSGLLALVIVTQTIGTRACDSPDPAPTPSPSPAPGPSPAPSPDTFTTQDGIRFRVETVATGLVVPWSMAFAPDGRLFVTERPGRVRVVNVASGTTQLALTLDDVFAQGEAGGLGLTLDPSFNDNQWVYLYYTATRPGGGVNRVVRYREVASQLVERVVLLDNIPANTIHDGGRIRFGPDGLLYITAGDAANTSLPQDLGSLAGKILRITRTGTVPPDNPFGSPVYSWGHRNPQGIDWHPTTGDLWASEHGQTGNDEINVIRSGINYGWPRIEGAATMPGMERPIVFFGTPAIAPSGASFYRGQRFPGFVNNLFVGALAGQHLLRLRISGRDVVAQERLLEGRFGRMRDVQSGPDGNLYVATNSDPQRILRLVPAP